MDMTPATKDWLLKEAPAVLSFFVGSGVLVQIARWYVARRESQLEDHIICNWQEQRYTTASWRTPKNIYNDCRRALIGDVPMWVLIPQGNSPWTMVTGFIRALPYQARHDWRVTFKLPSQKKVEKTILRLWKKGLLAQANFDGEVCYRLRPN
jgi:hypothetical protein